MASKSLLATCREFFGTQPDQSPMDFGREFTKLTNDDRKEIAAGLTKLGHDIDPTTIEKGGTPPLPTAA